MKSLLIIRHFYCKKLPRCPCRAFYSSKVNYFEGQNVLYQSSNPRPKLKLQSSIEDLDFSEASSLSKTISGFLRAGNSKNAIKLFEESVARREVDKKTLDFVFAQLVKYKLIEKAQKFFENIPKYGFTYHHRHFSTLMMHHFRQPELRHWIPILLKKSMSLQIYSPGIDLIYLRWLLQIENSPQKAELYLQQEMLPRITVNLSWKLNSAYNKLDTETREWIIDKSIYNILRGYLKKEEKERGNFEESKTFFNNIPQKFRMKPRAVHCNLLLDHYLGKGDYFEFLELWKSMVDWKITLNLSSFKIYLRFLVRPLALPNQNQLTNKTFAEKIHGKVMHFLKDTVLDMSRKSPGFLSESDINELLLLLANMYLQTGKVSIWKIEEMINEFPKTLGIPSSGNLSNFLLENFLKIKEFEKFKHLYENVQRQGQANSRTNLLQIRYLCHLKSWDSLDVFCEELSKRKAFTKDNLEAILNIIGKTDPIRSEKYRKLLQ